MKLVKVAAALIERDGRVLATQRGYGAFKDGWEFPGGKLEAGETAEEALAREIREELAADIEIGAKLCTVEHDYPDFHLSMDCFCCRLRAGGLRLLEHEAARWLAPEEMDAVAWLPADRPVAEAYRRARSGEE